MAISINDFRIAIRIDNSQAKPKLEETAREINAVEQAMKELEKQGKQDTDEYRRQQKSLEALHRKYYDLRKTVGLTGLTYNELRRNATKLRRDLNNTVPGTEKWKQLQADVKIVNARMKELRGTAQQTSVSLGKLSGGIKKSFASAASAVAAITGLTMTVRSSIDDYAKMQEAQAQVQKYTGMSADEVERLNDDFKQMDTRTAREQLNAIAGDAGRLGITSREAIEEFVDAADKISVALGEDLGENAVRDIGKLAQMFGEDKEKGLRGAMLATGSAVNELAQSSSAAADYIVDFTARFSGVGKQVGMTQAQIMGFASVLDQNMQQMETSSTVLSQLMTKMFQDPARFAKIAGMQVADFTKLIKEDANKALLQFLDVMRQKGGFDSLAPVFEEMKLSGTRATGVLSALATKIDDVAKAQKIATDAYDDGTSVINEFNVQNNTVQGNLDKAKKRFKDMRVELGEKLLPVMEFMIKTGTLTVKGLLALIAGVQKYTATLISTAAALALNIARLKIYHIWQNRSVVLTKLHVFWNEKLLKVLKSIGTWIKTNPWSIAITALGVLIGAFIDLNRNLGKTNELMKAQQRIRDKVNDQLATEAAKVDTLYAAIKNENLSNQERIDKINELKKIIPDYNGMISDEGRLINDNKTAIDHYLVSLEKQIKLKAAQEELEDLYKQKRKTDNQISTAATAYEAAKVDPITKAQSGAGMYTPVSANMAVANEDAAKATLENLKKKSIELKDAIAAINKEISSSDLIAERLKKEAEEAKRIAEEERKRKEAEAAAAAAAAAAENARKKAAEDETVFKESLDMLRKHQAEEFNELKKGYIKGTISEEEYQKKIYQIKLKYVGLQQALYAKNGKETADLQSQAYDLIIAETKRRQTQLERVSKSETEKDEKIKAPGKNLSEEYAIKKFSETLDGQQAILKAQYQAGAISYEEYQDRLTEILREKSQERGRIQEMSIEAVSEVANTFGNFFQAMQDAETTSVENKYNKQIKAAKKAGKDTTKLEQKKEEEVNAIRKKYADKQFAATAFQIIADTAAAVMKAWKDLGPILGPIYGAIATANGLVQLKIAETQRQQAKGLKAGGYNDEYAEGYTVSGNPNEVAGVIPVHKKEFVANHEAVENPHVRQFLDVFNIAQKRGTIRMLNTTRILEQVRTRSGYYGGGYTGPAATAPTTVKDGSIPEMLKRIIVLLSANNESLNTLSKTGLYVDVRVVRDELKRLDRLEHNASR